MFDFLSQSSLEIAAPATHHAIQWVRQWAAVSDPFDDLALRDDPSLSAPAADLVRRIVATIEMTEGVRVAQLPADRRQWYVEDLAGRLEVLAREQLTDASPSGADLLQGLRREWGPA